MKCVLVPVTPSMVDRRLCTKEARSLSVRASCRVVDDMSTIAMVESGFGISILPSLILERVHGDVNVYPIEPVEYREFGIAVQNPQMMAPAVRQMAAHIESYAAQRRAEDPQANQGFEPERHFL